MPIEIRNRFTGAVLLTVKGETLRRANLSGANLSGADLLRANLSGADLSRANLSRANLSGADLSGADLSGADLSWANLSGADLSGADLSGADLLRANLSGADLSRANLLRANLSGADLSGADLSGADLSWADLSGAVDAALALAQTLIVPQDGDVIGWKKLSGDILCKLLIPDGAKRFNAAGRKCRAERATVLEIEGAEVGYSAHDRTFEYRVGHTVTPRQPFDEDRWNECASGIHFFITREEAEAY